ncbi:MAG: hypothetical protein ACFFDT_10740 [Candidatus Hodarchaeota archaeon]
MAKDENPFENVPDDFVTKREEISVKKKQRKVDPILHELEKLPTIPYEFEDKSKLAMVAGFGFVFVAVLIYIGIVPKGETNVYIFSITSLIISILIPFFYMLDDLRIRPIKISERGTRFFAGILLAFLFILIFIMLEYFWPDFILIIYLLIIILLTNVSFTLFLYSMLWEE